MVSTFSRKGGNFNLCRGPKVSCDGPLKRLWDLRRNALFSSALFPRVLFS